MSIEAEQALFEACSAAEDDAAREALLVAHPDAALAARVRRLLEHAARADSTPDDAASITGGLPGHVGPFRVLERLGEGAIGEVFLAEQLQPVRRRVALKVLKPGLGSRELMARFDLERQTLAMMTHPAVARILDAGTTADGRPYFAMEYVPGIPITRYCDERRLTVAQRSRCSPKCAPACSTRTCVA